MDLVLDVIIILAALGLLVGVAYLLQKRKKPILGLDIDDGVLPVTAKRTEIWIMRGSVFLLVAITLGAILSNNLSLLWVSLGLILARIVYNVVAMIRHYFLAVSENKKRQ